MTEAEMGFRTAPLGFKREDVLAFIETETARRAQAEQTLAEREAALAQAEQEKEESGRAAAALIAGRDELIAAQAERDRTIEALREQLEQAKTETADVRTLLAQTQEQAAALQQSIEELRAENAALAAKCAEYDEARNRLADIELCAHGRAEELRLRAEADAQQLMRETQALAAQTLQAIEAAKEDYRQALSTARRESSAALERASAALDTLDGTADALSAQMGRVPVGEETKKPERPAEPAEKKEKPACCREGGKTLAEVLGGLRPGK